MLEIPESKEDQSHGWYCHCASIISGDASLHLHWIAPELTLRAMFKGEQFPSGGIP